MENITYNYCYKILELIATFALFAFLLTDSISSNDDDDDSGGGGLMQPI